MPRRAVILSGSLGLGHDVVSEILTTTLETFGWQSQTLDCMGLLGGFGAKVGDRVFRRLTSTPSVYDALHFSHFRTGSRLAMSMDRAATKRLVPAVEAALEEHPVDLVISAFSTGASTAAQLARRHPDTRTLVLCTDACLYRFWVWEEIDLFLVTSAAAAASVRRYVPRARVEIVPAPVRGSFYELGSQSEVRAGLGVPKDEPCALVMGGGWGLGPLATTAEALAREGVHVLAVAGRNEKLETRLEALARREPRVRAFGFTDRVPELMAAADVVITTPGATTCSEARVVGRSLVLLDVVPGHGRENLQHELELGDAEACDAKASNVTASVLASLERIRRPLPTVARDRGEWAEAFGRALAGLGHLARGPEASGRLLAV